MFGKFHIQGQKSNICMRGLGIGGIAPYKDDLAQWLNYLKDDGITLNDKLELVRPEPTLVGVNVLNFTGVTGGKLLDDYIVGDETVTEFVGSGVAITTANISAGRIDCPTGCILSSVTLSNGFKFVASAGKGLNCYDVSRTIWDDDTIWDDSAVWNDTIL